MTANNPAPKNYSTVCPYLMVDSIEMQMEFLQNVFGATIRENLKNDQGITMHGEVTIGDTVIMMGHGSKDFPSNKSMNYVYVNDVEEIYQKAKSVGSVPVFPPADRFYGVREAAFKDLQENTWFIAQFIKDVSIEDMEKGFAEKKSS